MTVKTIQLRFTVALEVTLRDDVYAMIDDATKDDDDATIDDDDETIDNDNVTIDNDDATIDDDNATIDDDNATIDDDDATIDDDDATINDDDATIDDGDAIDDANAHTARGTGQYTPPGARCHAGHHATPPTVNHTYISVKAICSSFSSQKIRNEL